MKVLRMQAAAVGAVSAFALLCGSASAATVHTITVQSAAYSGAPGVQDPAVQVSSDGTNWSPAYEVQANPAYATIDGTGWDSVSADAIAPVGNYDYQATVTLPPNAVNASLSGEYYSDNQGTASVNGVQVATNSVCVDDRTGADDFGGGGAPPASFGSSLNPGANTIGFTVNQCGPGEPTGLDFTATASYTLSPVSTADCKDGGWVDDTDRTGTSFTNQGDCVSYVATGGRNPADG